MCFSECPSLIHGTFIGLTCFLGFTALLASLIPAQRAMRVDPMAALRHD